jgi:2-dehydropantoate 2-reductase
VRYVIIGAGAIGGTIAARLAQQGLPVLLVARGEHGRVLSRTGLRLRTPDEDSTIRVDVVDGPDDATLHTDDVLVFATKTQQVESALLQWVDRPVLDAGGAGVGTAGELLPVLMALNGVASERIALRYFERVFGVCVWLPAVHLRPGEIILRIAPASGTFIVGRFAAKTDEADRELTAALGREWSAAGFRVVPVDDIMRWKYNKLLDNINNAVMALLGSAEDEALTVQARIRTEAENVFLAAGIEWTSEEETTALRGDDFAIRPVPGIPTELGGSTWQSLVRGSGSVETDFLNGEIAYLARSVGRRAPLNESVQRLMRRAAASGSRPGDLDVAGFTAALGGPHGAQ